MGIAFEPTCASFLAHWQSLRGDALIPTVEAFLNKPSPEHAPFLFISEFDAESSTMRLEGTGLVALWGRDVTGRRLSRESDPAYTAQDQMLFETITAHPCGCYGVNDYLTRGGVNLRVHVVFLPLAVQPGRLPRIVGYTAERAQRQFVNEEPMSRKRTVRELEWFDIGAGVPPSPRL